LIPGSGRSLGEGNGHPLQYSCLGNPTDRGKYTVSGNLNIMKIPVVEKLSINSAHSPDNHIAKISN